MSFSKSKRSLILLFLGTVPILPVICMRKVLRKETTLPGFQKIVDSNGEVISVPIQHDHSSSALLRGQDGHNRQYESENPGELSDVGSDQESGSESEDGVGQHNSGILFHDHKIIGKTHNSQLLQHLHLPDPNDVSLVSERVSDSVESSDSSDSTAASGEAEIDQVESESTSGTSVEESESHAKDSAFARRHALAEAAASVPKHGHYQKKPLTSADSDSSDSSESSESSQSSDSSSSSSSGVSSAVETGRHHHAQGHSHSHQHGHQHGHGHQHSHGHGRHHKHGSKAHGGPADPVAIDTDWWEAVGARKHHQFTEEQIEHGADGNEASNPKSNAFWENNADSFHIPSRSEIGGGSDASHGGYEHVRHGQQDTLAQACTVCKYASRSLSEAFSMCFVLQGYENEYCPDHTRACWAKFVNSARGVGDWKPCFTAGGLKLQIHEDAFIDSWYKNQLGRALGKHPESYDREKRSNYLKQWQTKANEEAIRAAMDPDFRPTVPSVGMTRKQFTGQFEPQNDLWAKLKPMSNDQLDTTTRVDDSGEEGEMEWVAETEKRVQENAERVKAAKIQEKVIKNMKMEEGGKKKKK